MIRVMLCDDHAMLRRGIRDTLTDAVDIQISGEAGSYPELREALRHADCDVLLLDINMPGRGGLEVLASLKETHPDIKVLIVSMYPEDQYALRSLKAGAHGYLNKAGPPEDLIRAVRTVMDGRKYLTAEVAQLLADSVSRPAEEEPHNSLSQFQKQGNEDRRDEIDHLDSGDLQHVEPDADDEQGSDTRHVADDRLGEERFDQAGRQGDPALINQEQET